MVNNERKFINVYNSDDYKSINPVIRQYYCPISFILILYVKRGREEKKWDSIKGDPLCFTYNSSVETKLYGEVSRNLFDIYKELF